MPKYTIRKKVNYEKENKEVRNKVDKISSIIKTSMNAMGYKKIEEPQKHEKNDYIFSIGGDGTMLHSMHNYISNDSVIIGINAGNLGFLTPFTIEDVENLELFDLISKGNFRVENRALLHHKIFSNDNKKIGYSVNEYAITSKGPNDILDFSITVEKNGIKSHAGYYKANALLISGPSGSTAYNMNAGGAIIDPSMRCIQIMMVAPQTIGVRPIVVDGSSIIKINSKNETKIFNDGMLIYDENKLNLEINMPEQQSSIMLPTNWNFYGVLAQKLHWNNGKTVY